MISTTSSKKISVAHPNNPERINYYPYGVPWSHFRNRTCHSVKVGCVGPFLPARDGVPPNWEIPSAFPPNPVLMLLPELPKRMPVKILQHFHIAG